MKKTDFGVVGFMYAVCAFFYVYSFDLAEGSETYPRFTIALLFGLTTLYLVQMIIAARKFGTESGVNEVFEGFKPDFLKGRWQAYVVEIRTMGKCNIFNALHALWQLYGD